MREVARQLRAVLDGNQPREVAASWASQWLLLPDPPDMDPSIWDALDTLSGIDLLVKPGQYLHHVNELYAWLQAMELQSG